MGRFHGALDRILRRKLRWQTTIGRFLEEHRDRVDAEAADRVMADDTDEIVPFERTTKRTTT